VAHGAWEELVLDNPEAHHALSASMMLQLAREVQALQGSPASVLLVRSVGPTFCSGGDLRDVRSSLFSPEAGRQMAEAMAVVLGAVRDLPLLSVSILDGPALGGGAELCTATDFRWGSPRARVHFVQASLGVAPGWGGTGRLVAIGGRSRALRWLALPAPAGAQEALEQGFLDGVAEDPMVGALAFVEPALRSVASVRAIKQQISGTISEAEAFSAVWAGPAHRAALERIR